MSEEKPVYNAEETKRNNAALKRYAMLQRATEDKIGCQKIYVDIGGGIEEGLVLDELIFYTLPKEETGKTSLRVWHDGFLWMAVKRADWWKRKRLKERSADRAIDNLVALGIVVKDLYKFSGTPTVHLRLDAKAFFAKYSQELSTLEADNGEDEGESIAKDIADLYEMMSVSTLPNGDAISPKSNATSPKSKVLNSIDTIETQSPVFSSNKPDAVDYLIEAVKSGIYKKSESLLAIESVIKIKTNIEPSGRAGQDFVEFCYKKAKNENQHIDQFLNWLTAQKDYNPTFWSWDKMREHWGRAFAEPVKKDKSHGL
jgi:hypothetical protein